MRLTLCLAVTRLRVCELSLRLVLAASSWLFQAHPILDHELARIGASYALAAYRFRDNAVPFRLGTLQTHPLPMDTSSRRCHPNRSRQLDIALHQAGSVCE